MKRTILIGLSLLTAHMGWAQDDFEYTLTGNASSMTVEVVNFWSGARFEGHSANQIVIEADDYRGMPDKARGLKALSAFGEDNTELGLRVEEKGNVVMISGASRSSRDTDYVIRIPENMKLKINSDDWNADDLEVVGLKNEVEIKANSANLQLEKVTGPLVLNSLNGEVTISFASLFQDHPSSITATNGDIDIAIPDSAKADFDLSCLNGEIYTDLNIEMNDDSRSKMNRIAGGMKVKGKIGGGGVPFTIHALNGNIYLRKK